MRAGVKELLVISQDTSAYGVDVKYRTGFWGGRPLKTRMTDLARGARRSRRVGAAPLRLSVPSRRRSDSAHGRAADPAVSGRAVSAREPAHTESDAAAGQRREQSRTHPRVAPDLSRAHDPQHVHRRISRERPKRSSRSSSRSSKKRSSTASAASLTRPSKAPRRTRCPAQSPKR